MKSIKKSVSEHIAFVRSSECGTLKVLVKKILLQLHKIHSEFDESSDEEEIEESDDESETKKSVHFFAYLMKVFLGLALAWVNRVDQS